MWPRWRSKMGHCRRKEPGRRLQHGHSGHVWRTTRRQRGHARTHPTGRGPQLGHARPLPARRGFEEPSWSRSMRHAPGHPRRRVAKPGHRGALRTLAGRARAAIRLLPTPTRRHPGHADQAPQARVPLRPRARGLAEGGGREGPRGRRLAAYAGLLRVGGARHPRARATEGALGRRACPRGRPRVPAGGRARRARRDESPEDPRARATASAARRAARAAALGVATPRRRRRGRRGGAGVRWINPARTRSPARSRSSGGPSPRG